MENKSVNIFNILLPIFLLVALMTAALINYPVIFDKAKETVVIVFVAIAFYILIWTFIKPDSFSKNGGLWIGFLFVVNISIEEFINWQTKTSTLVSTFDYDVFNFCFIFNNKWTQDTAYAKYFKRNEKQFHKCNLRYNNCALFWFFN